MCSTMGRKKYLEYRILSEGFYSFLSGPHIDEPMARAKNDVS